MPNKKATPLVHAGRGACQQDADRLGAPTRRRSRSSSAAACSATTTSPSSRRYIDWAPFFQTWDLAGASPRSCATRWSAHEATRVFSDGKRLLQRAHRGPLAAGARRDRPVLPAQHGGRRRHRDLRRRVAQRESLMTWRGAAPADRAPGGRRRETTQPLPGRLRRAARREADYVGLFAVTAAMASRRRKRSSTPTTTTTRRSC